jgi:hypothetical protein
MHVHRAGACGPDPEGSGSLVAFSTRDHPRNAGDALMSLLLKKKGDQVVHLSFNKVSASQGIRGGCCRRRSGPKLNEPTFLYFLFESWG